MITSIIYLKKERPPALDMDLPERGFRHRTAGSKQREAEYVGNSAVPLLMPHLMRFAERGIYNARHDAVTVDTLKHSTRTTLVRVSSLVVLFYELWPAHGWSRRSKVRRRCDDLTSRTLPR